MKQVFKVPTIHCQGCVESIKSKVTRLPGIQVVTGDPEVKTVTVQFDEKAVDELRIRQAIGQAGHLIGG